MIRLEWMKRTKKEPFYVVLVPGCLWCLDSCPLAERGMANTVVGQFGKIQFWLYIGAR